MPGVEPGARYKYEIRTQDGELRLKADPLRVRAPRSRRETASVVHAPGATSGATTLAGAAPRRDARSRAPMSIYEVHLGSWRRNPMDGNRR